MNAGMKRSLICIAMAALAIAASKPVTKPVDKPKETWCVGPIVALDANAGVFTIEVKEQGQSTQTQTSGPVFLGSFVVASSSAASEEQRSFQCATQCRFVTRERPSGATLADFKVGDPVRVTCVGTNAPWTAAQVVHHAPAPSGSRRN